LALFLKISSILPTSIVGKFDDLRRNLAKACIRISFNAYFGLMLFATFLTGFLTFLLSFIILSFGFPILQSALLGVFGGLFSAIISMVICYEYPSLEISSRNRKIDANIPLIANFMSVLASAGLPPERIIRSLANVGDEFSVGQETRRIIGDIELLGVDLNNALKKASIRSPSKKFASLLDGIVTTSHMGGDLSGYLREEADKYRRARLLTMKNFLETLGQIAEGYVSFMIALPLALIVMLSVMSFIGGGALIMGMDPQALLAILTFIITPAGVCIMLLLVDSATPPR
jgi:flagellar protein FlaJ